MATQGRTRKDKAGKAGARQGRGAQGSAWSNTAWVGRSGARQDSARKGSGKAGWKSTRQVEEGRGRVGERKKRRDKAG